MGDVPWQFVVGALMLALPLLWVLALVAAESASDHGWRAVLASGYLVAAGGLLLWGLL